MGDTLRYLNPPTMETPPGYSHVVEISGDARVIFFAGQLGVDKSGKLSVRQATSRPRRSRPSKT